MEASGALKVPGKQPQHGARREVRTARSRLLADSIARWTVTGGGMAIIASILGIFIFILIEVAPLAGGAKLSHTRERSLDGVEARAVLSDEHRSHVALLTVDGRIMVLDLATDEWVLDRPVMIAASSSGQPADGPSGVELLAVRSAPGQQLLTAATADGRALAVAVEWVVRFADDVRQVSARVGDPLVFDLDPQRRPLGPCAVRVTEEAATAAAQLADGTLVVMRREVEENLMTGEQTASWSRHEALLPLRLTALTLDTDQRNLYGGTAGGELLWWRLRAGEPATPQVVSANGAAGVSALSLLIGDRSVVSGHNDGSLAVWFPVRGADDRLELTKIREFPALPGAIELIAPSLRNKGFLAQDDSGRLGLYHSTSKRVLWTRPSPLPDATGLFYTPKADGAYLVAPGKLAELAIRNPHPEVSLTALFGKVWYEGYPEPGHVWQSTGGTDDFEPKLGLTPLMVGTLKGTIYSLFLAIPLGVLGAMYTSQFMHPAFRRYVKPTVEIMAALPSVVLGFLAGLWLAPRLEQMLPGLLVMLLLLPLLVVLAGLLWRSMPRSVHGRFPLGSETLLYMVVLAAGIWLCLELSAPFERFAFGGDLQRWLLDTTGLAYDQRNAVVVGLAMGFAVIPIIFSISEDAFSNVPRNLTSGSLALGANLWQTVTRIVLPTASPGIFSAIMIGFGRAVGETMIVLMATGNTPVMDWNPFNGFRTFSANIAVEIPEAPHGDTLYRTLFLAALILFVFTFVINTGAELVRQRLRKRYAQL